MRRASVLSARDLEWLGRYESAAFVGRAAPLPASRASAVATLARCAVESVLIVLAGVALRALEIALTADEVN